MEVKQVIVIRRDLKMRRGKEIAQGSHASMMWLSERLRKKKPWYIRLFSWLFGVKVAVLSEEEWLWIDGPFAKVTLQVENEAELLLIYGKAESEGLTVYMVTDSGRTEFNGVPTRTALAIGPHEVSRVNEVTGSLKLY